MPLAHDRPEGLYAIRWVDVRSLRIDDNEYSSSLLLMPDQIWPEFPAHRPQDFDAELIERVLALGPQVVVLGTGQRQVFAPPRVQASFLGRGIGLECMDNAAAARTYNLLALEGRRVAGIFLIEAP